MVRPQARAVWPQRWWWKRLSALRFFGARRRGLRLSTRLVSAPPAPATPPSPATPPPFAPDKIGRNPRRVRAAQPLRVCNVDRMAIRGHGVLLACGKLLRASELPFWPPEKLAVHRQHLKPLLGIRYGPLFTCPVDTLLTLVQHVFTSAEQSRLKHGAYNSTGCVAIRAVANASAGVVPAKNGSSSICAIDLDSDCGGKSGSSSTCVIDLDSDRGGDANTAAEEAESTRKWVGLLRALKEHRRGNANAKMRWYKRMNCDHSTTHGKSCKCHCRCRCPQCTSGRCVLCARCDCKVRRFVCRDAPTSMASEWAYALPRS